MVDAGGDVAITVTTKPNAFVGVAAIDQSSLLLRKRNDLTEVMYKYVLLCEFFIWNKLLKKIHYNGRLD